MTMKEIEKVTIKLGGKKIKLGGEKIKLGGEKNIVNLSIRLNILFSHQHQRHNHRHHHHPPPPHLHDDDEQADELRDKTRSQLY